MVPLVIALLIIASGQVTAEDADQTADQAKRAARLAEAERLSDLKYLLEKNGVKDADSIAQLGSIVDPKLVFSLYHSLRDTGFVDKATTITTRDGKQYHVAIVNKKKSRFGLMGANTDAAYFFGPEGDLRFQIGGDFASDGVNGHMIKVMKMGTKDTWFVVTSRYEPEVNRRMVTTVYGIDGDKPPRILLRFVHRSNDLGHTYSESEADDIGAGFTFTPRPEEYQQDAIGRLLPEKIMPRIVWDPEQRVFKGKASAKRRGTFVYSVDLKASSAFKAVEE